MTGPATQLLTKLMDERTRLVTENERLHARVIELEAEIALMRGTLSRHDATDDDQPAVIHYDVEPNAPR